MKSKFTAILMFLVTTAIIAIAVILGIALFEEIRDNGFFGIIQTDEEVELFKTTEYPIASTVEDVEVPQIKDGKNPLQINTNVNYDNVTINKYFYNQLNKYSQIIYKAFESNKDNMKSGIYKINLGDSFSDILSKEDGKETLQKYYQSAIEAYLYENPDVFYLSPSSMFLNIETTTRGNKKTYNTYIDCGQNENYFIEEFNSNQKVREALNKIESVKKQILKNRTGNTYKDIKMVHDYLVNNIQYDSTLSNKNIYNIYGALVNNKCVCEGYAKSFKYLLDALGIDCVFVMGKGIDNNGNSENHAWNYVKIDNSWYAVDVTWDDPIIIGNGVLSKESKYKYFLKGKNTIDKDHFPSGQFTNGGMVFKYPSLSSVDY